MLPRLLPLLVFACAVGDADGPPADTDTTVGEPVTQVIGPEGGTIAAEDAAGRTLTLVVPAGALAEPTPFTVRALAAGEDVVRFAVSPAGLVPAQAVTATLDVPADPPTDGRFFWDDDEGRALVGGRWTGGRLEVVLPTVGFRTEGEGSRVARVADADADDTVLAVGTLACADRVDELEAAFRDTLRRGDPDAIAREGGEILALRESCAEGEIVRLGAAACARYDATETAARSLAVDDEATLRSVLGTLVRARAAIELAGAACEPPGFTALVEEKVGQFVTFVDAQYRRTPFSTDVEAHLDRLDELVRYEVVCTLAGASSEACEAVSGTLLPPTLDRLRAAAYADCRARGNPFAVAAVLRHPLGVAAEADPSERYFTYAGYTYGDLESDVDHCGSEVEVRAFADAETVPDEIVEARLTLAAGDTPGTPPDRVALSLPAGGGLTIGGRVTAPPCLGARDVGDDGELTAVVNGVVLARAARDGDVFAVTSQKLDVTVREALQAAGLPEAGGTYVVQVRREGGSCPLYRWPRVLYELEVSVGVPEVRASLLLDPPGSSNYEYVSERIVTGVDCDEEEVFGPVSEVPLAADTPLPTVQQAGGSSLAFTLPSRGRVAVRATCALPPAVSDTCTDGFVDTNASTLLFGQVLRVEPVDAAVLSLTWEPRWVSGSWRVVDGSGVSGRSGSLDAAGRADAGAVPAGGALVLDMGGVIADVAGLTLTDAEILGVQATAAP